MGREIPIFTGVTMSNLPGLARELSDAFRDHKILAIRGTDFSPEESFEILKFIGDWCDFIPNHQSPYEWRYEETHERTLIPFKSRGTNTDQHIIVTWHLKHAEFEYPQVAAAWNMRKFSCDPHCGKTGFIDMGEAFSQMPRDWRDFLSSSKVAHSPLDDGDHRTYEDLYGHDIIERVAAGESVIWASSRHLPLVITDAVQRHWLSNEKILRMTPSQWPELIAVDNAKPTRDQKLEYAMIIDWLIANIYDSRSWDYWWEWQEHDILIPDLFSLAHAVTGGFEPGSRIFTGFWGYPNCGYIQDKGRAGAAPNRTNSNNEELGYWAIGETPVNEPTHWTNPADPPVIP